MRDEQIAAHLLGLIVTASERIAFVLRGSAHWHAAADYTFLPLEVPGVTLVPAAEMTLAEEAVALARRDLGCEAALVPSARLYGPSAAHMIDRLTPLPDEESLLPLLRLRRMVPRDDDGSPPRLELVRAYRATLDAMPMPGPGAVALVWLPLEALRRALRGLPLAELLALEGVTMVQREAATLPERAMVYLPAEYGERYLLRIAAKYGAAALFQ